MPFRNIQLDSQGAVILLIISIWEILWKGIGLWRSAKNNQNKWFIAILIVNTLGVLPIVYLKFFQKKAKS